jgi:pimeloyl-ACP methyl ester carboxylesterase
MSRVLGVLLFIVLLVVAWQAVRTPFPEHEREIRSKVKSTVESIFPEQAAQAKARFGLVRLHEPQAGMSDVVLVHGLDDPGMVWMNLAPALHAAGHGVSVLNYPNDQPVRDSARLFADELQSMFTGQSEKITIVAHSMGGLVSREMLSSPGLRCGGADCRMPGVARLIMIGTPNHGSYLARFRGLGELREQLSRMIDGEAGWLDSIFDGSGEAGLDLMPGSAFLTELNSRAYPEGTAMYVIAGVIAKEEAESLAGMIERLESDTGGALVVPLVEQLGDGLVSVESARLAEVPLFRVSGNHLSIIRNISTASERVPPAIPIVLQLLQE